MRQSEKVFITLIISLICILLCIAGSLALGSRSVSPGELIDALFLGKAETFGQIVVRERIPRTVFSLIAGAALGISGALMQAITRNPIADPSVLGVNTGASLFVVMGIAFLNIQTAGQYIVLALLGAAITAVFVYGIGSLGAGGATPQFPFLAGRQRQWGKLDKHPCSSSPPDYWFSDQHPVGAGSKRHGSGG